MNQYLYALVLPVAILLLDYFFRSTRPTYYKGLIIFLLRDMPLQFGYLLLIYYLDSERHIDTGWGIFTLVTFLIPIAVLLVILRLVIWLRDLW